MALILCQGCGCYSWCSQNILNTVSNIETIEQEEAAALKCYEGERIAEAKCKEAERMSALKKQEEEWVAALQRQQPLLTQKDAILAR